MVRASLQNFSRAGPSKVVKVVKESAAGHTAQQGTRDRICLGFCRHRHFGSPSCAKLVAHRDCLLSECRVNIVCLVLMERGRGVQPVCSFRLLCTVAFTIFESQQQADEADNVPVARAMDKWSSQTRFHGSRDASDSHYQIHFGSRGCTNISIKTQHQDFISANQKKTTSSKHFFLASWASPGVQ